MSNQHGTQYELHPAASDGVTSLSFARDSNALLVSSWDASLRIYDATDTSLRQRLEAKSALLSTCFGGDSAKAYAGQLDGGVQIFDLKTRVSSALGSHEQGVKCVDYSPTTGQIISGSWDKTAKLWDPRSPTPLTEILALEGKVFSMSTSNQRLLLATSSRQVYVYDLRNLSGPEQLRESPLKYQTRCIRAFPEGDGYAMGSIEGKVAIEYFDLSQEIQKKKYVFKCHRHNIGGVDTVFPVNDIAFHPIYGTFATGGCDGYVTVWDWKNKKKLSQFSKYPTSISALEFNYDGSLLAVASSYTFEEGEKDHPEDAVYIRVINQADFQPYNKK